MITLNDQLSLARRIHLKLSAEAFKHATDEKAEKLAQDRDCALAIVESLERTKALQEISDEIKGRETRQVEI